MSTHTVWFWKGRIYRGACIQCGVMPYFHIDPEGSIKVGVVVVLKTDSKRWLKRGIPFSFKFFFCQRTQLYSSLKVFNSSAKKAQGDKMLVN